MEPQLLLKHPAPNGTEIFRFKQLISTKYDVNLESYADLHAWSVENLEDCWHEIAIARINKSWLDLVNLKK